MPTPPADPTNPRVGTVVVLAAGAGTRMRSRIPKVLHPVAGRPLLWHAVTAAAALQPDDLVAVVGHGREQVSAYLTGEHPGVRIAVQEVQLGTGHAVASALQDVPDPSGTVLVTYGDTPLLRPETLQALVRDHAAGGRAVTVLTAEVADPTGYGRIVRDADGAFAAIVEHRDATVEQRAVREINSGVYAFDGPTLARLLPQLTAANAQGERYLTDVIGLAVAEGAAVGTVSAEDPQDTEGVNDRVQLAAMSRALNDRIVREHQLAGVTVLDPATTWIHSGVTIGADTVIRPGSSIEAGTVIGEGCDIGPDTTLSACVVGDGATVLRSHCSGAHIGPDATVGPFTFLRPDARLLEGAKAGAYVEIKKSTIGAGSKVPHLSYVGDATVGTGANIGAGTITANYDGVGKYATTIGDHAFVGTNTTLIAPVTVADGAFVAAGSTITDDVPPGDLAVARGRQRNVDGWVTDRRPDSPAARAAAGQPTAPSPEVTTPEVTAAGEDHRP
ncbi:bifunctional UDP-N-acetylglucosamine diphosphorylase/glucosamine-1-phosphate N-acetyltransferase GlmU [Nakamurella alba]|uniref:bifunctional UDP-N-acetylglucosamine diphosphorylase/glucosamine-1-phosphate N-acetyltransferase GlmU n=1 Tax=Nakamurella alba TaxID=2665158 RepID=UPI002AC353DE|nr:bifunctional UDP-N-acetylglucosamine diphosphorylase/glucosamine-1-phosphate N-acetyltransferase GlmU [Nakamurella alba]